VKRGSVEYSVMLAIICLLVVGAAAVLGTTVRASLQAAGLASSFDPRQSAPAMGDAAFSGTPDGSPPMVTAGSHGVFAGIVLGVAALAGIFAAAGFLARLSRRHRRQTAENAPRDVPEAQILETKNKLFAKRQELLKMLHFNVGLLTTNEIVVRHLMTANPATVLPGTKVEDVKSLMEARRCHHLLVCGKDLELLGVISDRDLRGRMGRTAQQIMTPQPNFVSPETPLGIAITHLVARQISCLPVVDDGRVCGVLTTTDLVLVAHAFLQMWLRLTEEGNPVDDDANTGRENEGEEAPAPVAASLTIHGQARGVHGGP
jgi:CBS domain-containing protein